MCRSSADTTPSASIKYMVGVVIRLHGCTAIAWSRWFKVSSTDTMLQCWLMGRLGRERHTPWALIFHHRRSPKASSLMSWAPCSAGSSVKLRLSSPFVSGLLRFTRFVRLSLFMHSFVCRNGSMSLLRRWERVQWCCVSLAYSFRPTQPSTSKQP